MTGSMPHVSADLRQQGLKDEAEETCRGLNDRARVRLGLDPKIHRPLRSERDRVQSR